MALPIVPQPFQSGFRLIDGSLLNSVLANDQTSTQDAVALSGTTRATAFQVTTNVTRFTTVPASTIALLPQAVPGQYVILINSGAQTLTMNGFVSTDTIDGNASATLSTANRAALLYCLTAGAWISFLLGATTS